jgi:hypothetical protein
MTIAQQIKAFHQDSIGRVQIEALVAECEDAAVTTDQDWDAESTTYIFSDGSCIVCCGPEVSAYGSAV